MAALIGGCFLKQEALPGLRQMLDHVPAISDLRRVRRSPFGSFCSSAAAIPAADFSAWMGQHPGGKRFGCSIRHQITRNPLFQITEDRAEGDPAPKRAGIHAQHARRGRRGSCAAWISRSTVSGLVISPLPAANRLPASPPNAKPMRVNTQGAPSGSACGGRHHPGKPLGENLAHTPGSSRRNDGQGGPAVPRSPSRGERPPEGARANGRVLNSTDRAGSPPLERSSKPAGASSCRRRQGASKVSRWERGAASALPAQVVAFHPDFFSTAGSIPTGGSKGKSGFQMLPFLTSN